MSAFLGFEVHLDHTYVTMISGDRKTVCRNTFRGGLQSGL